MATKTLPIAAEAEVAVLGGLLQDGTDAVDDVLERIGAEDFGKREHQAVYTAIQAVRTRGSVVDPIVVGEELRATGDLDWIGGMAFLAELLEAVPTTANLAWHADLVRDRSLRRRLHAAAAHIATEVKDDVDTPLLELLDRAERRVLEVAHAGVGGGDAVAAKGLLAKVFKRIQAGTIQGIPSPWPDLNEKLVGRGFLPGQLVIVAGATSMGKSAASLRCVLDAAVEHCAPSLICSIEMTNDENACRLLAIDGEINLKSLFEGGDALNDGDYERLAHAATRIHAAPLFFHDRATTVIEVRSQARRIKSRHGLRLVLVDHMQDMNDPAEERRNQLGNIARGLKQLAKELQITVIAVSQLSRKPEERSDPRPRISDLRESGDIEGAADLVLMCYRPEYYFGPTRKTGRGKDAKDEDLEGKAELIIGKQRNGPLGTVPLYFRKESARFESMQHWGNRR